jgi:hypothetical protein
MLDVHPPHSPTHTWKDFFIHVGTIVIGLLIAVGLEQTVEVIHHRHSAADARASIQEETSDNLEVLHYNLQSLTRGPISNTSGNSTKSGIPPGRQPKLMALSLLYPVHS